MSLSPEARDRIASLIEQHPVVLFMKGDRASPQCGFSATVVGILDRLLPSYATYDVLQDHEVRAGIKEFSDWPTIPQLYVRGEFQGGCDIVQEMYASGELQEALGLGGEPPKPPVIDITDAARDGLAGHAERAGGQPLHLTIDARFQYSLGFGPRAEGELESESNGVRVLFDPESARRADGLRLDVRDGKLSIDNPNEPRVGEISPTELERWRREGREFRLYDVRSAEERAQASIAGSILLDAASAAELERLDHSTLLVFHCHHGGRSSAAAKHYASLGFENVYNLVGGIEAWSTDVDPDVPRY